MIHFKKYIFFILVSIFCVKAQDGNKLVAVKYYFEKNTLKSGDSIRVLASVTPSEGWHVYWKNPGDAGLATNIEPLEGSKIKIGEIKWENPHYFKTEDIMNFGYGAEFFMLFTIYASSDFNSEDLNFSLKCTWLVCKEKCVSGSKVTKIDNIAIRNTDVKKWKSLYKKFSKNLPVLLDSSGFEARKHENAVELSWSDNELKDDAYMIYPVQEGIFKYEDYYKVNRINNQNFISLKLDNLRIAEPEYIHLILVPAKKKSKQTYELILKIIN